MGALCCCFSSDEDYLPHQQGAALWRHCACLRNCLPWFFTQYDEVNDQEAVIANQAAAGGGELVSSSNNNNSNVDTSIPEVFRAPPAPLPYDSDPRFLRNAGLSRRDKSSGVSYHETLRHSSTDGGGGTALQRRNPTGTGTGVEPEESLKPEKNAKAFPRIDSVLSILDDDDVCPTCLDEYTIENPKITTECGHDFHLACIYEWMERSNRCPICDKEMAFSEV